MRRDKILPRGGLASLRRRSDAVAAQDVSHRLIGQGVPQIGDRPDDTVVSPVRVFPCHSHHQGLYLRSNSGAAGILPVFGPITTF